MTDGFYSIFQTVAYGNAALPRVARADGNKKKGSSGELPFFLELVPEIGVEPTTFALRMRCSTN